MNKYVELKTNIPEIVTFKFGTWKRWENQGDKGPYVKYSIGVENRGEDKYLSIYEKEYIKYFEPLGNLQDREIEILKYEDGKYKAWKLMEKGVEITPKATQHTAPTIQPAQPEDRVEKMAFYIKNTLIPKVEELEKSLASANTKIEELRKEVGGLKTLSVDMNGKDAVDLHASFPVRDVHKAKEIVEGEIPVVGGKVEITESPF